MSDFDAFTRGFHGGMGMVKEYQESAKRKELADLSKESETKAFTVQQGQELEAISNAKDQHGNPYYKLDANQDGTYTVTPNFKDETGETSKDYTPAKIAAKGVMYLGNNYDAPLDEKQKSAAKTAAMAGVYEKYGDVEGAARVRSLAKQDRAADLSISAAESQERQTKRAEEMQGKADAINQDVASYTEKFSKNPDGTDRQLSYDDHLHLGQYKASKLMSAGMVDEASKLASQNMQFTANKIQVETAERDKALGLAAAAAATGDLSGFKNFYNKFIPDGAQTTAITPQKDGKIVVSRVGVDGEPMAPHTFKDVNELIAAAQSINKPEALYNYSNNEFHRSMQEKQLNLQKQQVGISGAHLKLQQDQRDREIKKEKDIQAAGVGLYSENNPKATPAAIEAVRTGVLPVIQGKDQPAEVKLAQALLSAGSAKDMKEALQLAVTKKSQSPDDLRNDFVSAGLKNYKNPTDAVGDADKLMQSMGYVKKNGSWSNAPIDNQTVPAKPKDANEAAEQARAAIKAGIPLSAVNAKLMELGYPPLD